MDDSIIAFRCSDELQSRFHNVRWFGQDGYQLSEPVDLGFFQLGDYQVWVEVEGRRFTGENSVGVGIEASYKIFKDGVLVRFSDQRGISPMFSIEQILDNARHWLERYEGVSS